MVRGLKEEQKNLISNLDARLKVGILAVVSIMLSFANWSGLLLTSISLVGMIILARTPLRLYRGVLGAVSILALFYVGLSGWVWDDPWKFWQGHWSVPGLKLAFLLIWRLGIIFILTRLFIAVTSPLEQGLGIAYFFTPLVKINPKAADFSLLLTLTLRFVPMIKEEWAMIWKGWIVQGKKEDGILEGLKRIIRFLPALLLITFQRAEEVGENMIARGYGSGKYRVVFIRSWQKQDSWGAAIAFLFVLILLLVQLA